MAWLNAGNAMQEWMAWSKRITKLYGDGVAVTNMSSSWKNGLAFCAIIHHFRPDLINFHTLSKENIAYNNKLAFTTAEEQLGIPALLDVDDMVEMTSPDRLSILTYLSQYYNYFKDKIPGEVEAKKPTPKKLCINVSSSSNRAITTKTCKEVPVAVPKANPQPVNKNTCWTCSKRVYMMERFAVGEHVFHRACFKCHTCDKQLHNTTTYHYDKMSSKFYCAEHFKKLKRESQKAKSVCEKQVLPSESGRETNDKISAFVQQKKRASSVSRNICRACTKVVHLMERLSVERHLFHRVCFKCTVCDAPLKNGAYEFDESSSKFYCLYDYNGR